MMPPGKHVFHGIVVQLSAHQAQEVERCVRQPGRAAMLGIVHQHNCKGPEGYMLQANLGDAAERQSDGAP